MRDALSKRSIPSTSASKTTLCQTLQLHHLQALRNTDVHAKLHQPRERVSNHVGSKSQLPRSLPAFQSPCLHHAHSQHQHLVTTTRTASSQHQHRHPVSTTRTASSQRPAPAPSAGTGPAHSTQHQHHSQQCLHHAHSQPAHSTGTSATASATQHRHHVSTMRTPSSLLLEARTCKNPIAVAICVKNKTLGSFEHGLGRKPISASSDPCPPWRPAVELRIRIS